MHYKREKHYGTVLGGCCSLCITAIVTLIIVIQLWTFIFKTSFSENIEVDYLKRGQDQLETVNLVDFMPSFAIVTEKEDGTIDWNNQDMFTFYF